MSDFSNAKTAECHSLKKNKIPVLDAEVPVKALTVELWHPGQDDVLTSFLLCVGNMHVDAGKSCERAFNPSVRVLFFWTKPLWVNRERICFGLAPCDLDPPTCCLRLLIDLCLRIWLHPKV